MGVGTPQLKRSIGLRTVVSTSAGLTFASSTFLVVVQVACYLAGDSAWIAILIAGILCALAAASFSELNGMFPSVNGIRLYIHRAFGEKISLVASLTYMTVVTLVVGTEAFVLSHVLTAAIPAVAPPWWIFLMLTVATLVNFRGLKLAGAMQDIITYSVIVSILTMSILALARVHFEIPRPLSTGGAGSVFTAVGFAIFLFIGFEWVTPLADEVENSRSISSGMFIALVLLVVVYSLFTTAMFANFGSVSGRAMLFGTHLNRQPIPHLVFAFAALGPVGRWCMILTSLCMSLTTFNAGLIGVSRFIYGMARDTVLPKQLAHISEKFSTPDRATLLVYAIALTVSAVVYATQKFVLLVNLAAATESLIYGCAAACVVSLRIKDTERTRTFRMWGGYALPALTAVLFLAVGVGVFTPSGTDYWGAAVLLVLLSFLWWIYIHFFALPRIIKSRLAVTSKRISRRPVSTAHLNRSQDKD